MKHKIKATKNETNIVERSAEFIRKQSEKVKMDRSEETARQQSKESMVKQRKFKLKSNAFPLYGCHNELW